jgi:integrase/recombinase XerC
MRQGTPKWPVHISPIKAAVDEFLLGFSNPLSRRNYEGEIKRLNEWFAPWTGQEDNLEILKFLRHMEPSLSPQTLRGRVIRLRKFYDFLIKKKVRSNNPVELSYAPQVKDVRRPRCLNRDELQNLCKILCTRTFEDLRDYCLISLMLGDALRIHEVSGLNRGDLEKIDDQLWCQVRGKGGRLDTIVLFPKTQRLLERYLRRADFEAAESPLFYSLVHAGQRLSVRGIRKRVEKIFAKAGIRDGLSAHSLRHTHAAILSSQGYPVTGVQKRLRHSSPMTTLKYYFHDEPTLYAQAHNRVAKLLGLGS